MQSHLRDDGKSLSEVVQSQRGDVDLVNLKDSLWLSHTEQRLH